MNWLALVAIVVAAGVFVFAVLKDKANGEALTYLYNLIENIIDIDEDDGR